MGKETKEMKEVKGISDLPGVGPQAVEKLMAAGYKTLEAIAFHCRFQSHSVCMLIFAYTTIG